MFYKKKKDFIFRKKFLKLEYFKIILSFLQRKFSNVKITQKLKYLIMGKVYASSLQSKTKLVRRCVLTNRGRAIKRPYNISRVILRDMLQSSILPGYSKAVW